MQACGGRRGDRERCELSPLSGGFHLILAGRNLRGGHRGGFQQNIHQFARCALSGSGSLLMGQCWGSALGCPPSLAAFWGLELKYTET